MCLNGAPQGNIVNKRELFTIDKDTLVNLLNTMRGGVVQTGMFGMSNLKSAVYIEGQNNQLYFLSNTGFVGASCVLSDMELASEFEFVLDFTTLYSFMNTVESDLVTFFEDGTKVILQDGADTITLVTVTTNVVKDPPVCEDVFGTFNVEEFQHFISKPLRVTGVDVLSGVVAQGIMLYGDKVVGTTREYMSVVELPYEKLDLPLFIPRELVKELDRFSGFDTFEFRYSVTALHFQFEKKLSAHRFGKFTLFGQQLDRAQFPDISVVTKQDYIDRCVINPVDMLRKAQKLRVLDKDKGVLIKLEQIDDDLYLSSRETLIGNSLQVKLSPKEVLWSVDTLPGFKLKHLIDVFSTFNPKEDVVMASTDKEAVFTFKQGGHTQYLTVFRI